MFNGGNQGVKRCNEVSIKKRKKFKIDGGDIHVENQV